MTERARALGGVTRLRSLGRASGECTLSTEDGAHGQDHAQDPSDRRIGHDRGWSDRRRHTDGAGRCGHHPEPHRRQRPLQTAAAVSAATFSPNVRVAYIATGADFPDALAAASPAAKAGGPVLLTQPRPSRPRRSPELQRLKPAKIIVLGGTSSVAQSVQDRAAAVHGQQHGRRRHPDPGLDRYATAAAISAATYSAGVNTVYVASGAGLPRRPGRRSRLRPTHRPAAGPLLLVQAGAIPDSDQDRAAAPRRPEGRGARGHLDGERAVVTALDAVQRQPGRPPRRRRPLPHLGGHLERHVRTRRRRCTWPPAPRSPTPSPGARPPGFVHGPVLLTQANCIPPAVNDEITRLNPTQADHPRRHLVGVRRRARSDRRLPAAGHHDDHRLGDDRRCRPSPAAASTPAPSGPCTTAGLPNPCP